MRDGTMLRRAGLGLLVGAVLIASSGASAGPALVFEPYNGTVFYAEDPDAQWFPASLTKLMTAYVAFQAIKAGTITPDTKLICSKEATEQAPSKLWLKVGESITLDVALKVLIVQSANDVAVMIAEPSHHRPRPCKAHARHHHRVPRARRSVHHRRGSGGQADHTHA